MQQIVITKYGDPDVLKIQEKKDPKPSAGEVLIKVKAIGVNFADILARKGLYPDAPKPPCVVGYEVSGIIETAGQGVDSSLVGNSVLALTRFNGYSDKVCVSENAVFTIPGSLDFEKAAAIPVNYLTAYQLLCVMGGLKKGESVLIHNAGGGVVSACCCSPRAHSAWLVSCWRSATEEWRWSPFRSPPVPTPRVWSPVEGGRHGSRLRFSCWDSH